ncbi:MAG: hypothetical protein U9P10_08755 [Thermodesulfobacteriota bacterium]|nr:hypothetical protein [Thermodesulfobacteriota bacterium]
MYITALILFLTGICAGGLYGFVYDKSAFDLICLTAAGGFAGSAAGGILFTYFYFTSTEELTETSRSQSTSKDSKALSLRTGNTSKHRKTKQAKNKTADITEIKTADITENKTKDITENKTKDITKIKTTGIPRNNSSGILKTPENKTEPGKNEIREADKKKLNG